MSVFTSAEIAYLQSQRIARIATAAPDGQPHVVPVSFRYHPNADTIDVGGHDFARRKKYCDVQRNPRVAIVVDDLASIDAWRPRMIEVRGEAEVLPTGGEAIARGFDPEMFRIRPRRIISFRYRRRWILWPECSVRAVIDLPGDARVMPIESPRE